MSLLNPALLVGLGLAVIPVLLHLLMRAKPRRLVFPALRLIQQSKRQNVRRMQLRHLWLLLLRIAVIALIVVAVCRPSLPAANYSLNWREWASIIVIGAFALGTYFGVMHWWRLQALPRASLLTRRSMLRGAVGVGTALLAVLGVVWPYVTRVAADIKNPAPRVADNVPVAAVFLFDTSASMAYRQANKTRLRAAQDMAKAHLRLLPSGSKVAVASSSELSPTAFSTDLVAAQNRIESLEISSTSSALNDRIATLLQVQEEDRRRVSNEQTSVPEDRRQDRFVREIYLFTDLAKTAWRDDSSQSLRDELQRLRSIGLYLIDVGEEAPINVALTGLRLSREAVPAGGSVRIEAAVSATGQVKPEQTVELYLRSATGDVRKGAETVKLATGAEARVAFFPVDVSTEPYTQGELRLSGADPLSVDEVAFFTVHSIPSLKVLVVAERPAVSQYWVLALKNLAESGVSAFQTEVATPAELAERDLRDCDVVCMINARQPSDAAWQKLKSFVAEGGGLAVFLGAGSSVVADTGNSDRINPVAYRSQSALEVLPARLEASLSHSPAKTMDLRRSQHQLLKRFEELGVLTELGNIDIRRYWKVEPLADSAVVARYTGTEDDSGVPALVERRIGQGRVMLMTTGVDGIAWNDLPSLDNWLYVVFVDQLTQYMAWQASGTFNHIIGDEVSLPLDRDRKLTKAILRMPDFKQRAIDIPADSRILNLRDLTAVGSYSVDSADQAVNYRMGFSLNPSPAESDLQRLDNKELDATLGEGRYSINRDVSSLERNVSAGRLGQEMYGMVVAILVAAFALEQFTATWFYRTDES